MDLVEVTWYDAVDRNDIKLDDIKKKSTKEYLSKRKTYGLLAKKDKFGIVLIRDIDQENVCEITSIPAKWIIKITKPIQRGVN